MLLQTFTGFIYACAKTPGGFNVHLAMGAPGSDADLVT
jgi:hypothetical protein